MQYKIHYFGSEAVNGSYCFFSGQALSCIQCVSFGNRSCDGLSVSCRLDNVCGASYTVTTSGFSVVSRIYMRVCVPKNQCNLQVSLSVINVMSRFGGSCCNTDNCTPDLPTLPAVNTTFNGLVCRTCVSADSDWCYTKDTVQCTGNENMCLLQTTSILLGRVLYLVGLCAPRVCHVQGLWRPLWLLWILHPSSGPLVHVQAWTSPGLE
uniref:UPAR/Ly6 domain-containing protein n=1 Tax=Leptobrachium leishanense TaxID=445787 RepID=A0A8C5PIA8_9ANUR